MPTSENGPSVTFTTISAPSIDVVKRISLFAEPVSRNLQITACYHELSTAFASRTGIVANWCTFATWASKQAGVTIRGEDLQRRLEEVLAEEREIQDILAVVTNQYKKLGNGSLYENIPVTALRKLAASAMQRASDAVARGNKKVFEEIGFEFARFIVTCLRDEVYRESSINDFCKMLRPGPPPGGQEQLSGAFKFYYKAFFETEIKTRDELILLANIKIGFHEQTRLQPEIAESLNAAHVDPQQVRDHLTDILVNNKSFKNKIIYFFTWIIGGTRLLKNAIDSLVLTAEKHIRKVITKHLMTLTLPPDNCLHLGDDMNAPFPENLTIIRSTDLIALLKELRPASDSIDGSGCTDWSDLKQRIHYIANLFRCYHETKDLFNAAFTAEQLSVIKTGKIPGGRL